MHVNASRIKQQSGSNRTADFDIRTRAQPMRRKFSDVMANGDTCFYLAVDDVAGDWETGVGSYRSSTTTLIRRIVRARSNGGRKVDFANAPIVMQRQPGEQNSAIPLYVPKVADFIWGNQPSGTTATDESTGLVMVQPSLGAGNNLGVLWDGSAYPATPFTLTVGIRMTMPANEYYQAGLIVGDSSGKIIVLNRTYVAPGGTAPPYNELCQVTYLTNYTTFSSTPAASNIGQSIGYFAFHDDGTDLTFYIGADLNALVQVYQATRTAFLSAPSKRGIFIDANDNNTTGLSMAATFFHYAVS